MRTPNARQTLRWTNHLAPAVRVGSEIYMIDPAMNPHQPVRFRDWLKNLGLLAQPLQNTRIAICSTYTYHATQSSCSRGSASEELTKSMENTLRFWLPNERDRLEELGRNVDLELGQNPPW